MNGHGKSILINRSTTLISIHFILFLIALVAVISVHVASWLTIRKLKKMRGLIEDDVTIMKKLHSDIQHKVDNQNQYLANRISGFHKELLELRNGRLDTILLPIKETIKAEIKREILSHMSSGLVMTLSDPQDRRKTDE